MVGVGKCLIIHDRGGHRSRSTRAIRSLFAIILISNLQISYQQARAGLLAQTQDLSGANTSKEWVDHGALIIQTIAEWFCLVTTWPWSSQCWGRLEDYWPRMMRTLLMLVTALKLPSSSHQWALRAQHCILIVRICTKNAIYQESTCSEW